ncbi:MAG: hypothetical protein H7328_12065 [Bdellovibrio sp.]|nr:hypothetical protein [Bdellovibrio sp.]
MKNKILAALILFSSISASAGYSGVYGYDRWVPELISDYQDQLLQPTALELTGQSNASQPQVCAPVYSVAVAKRSLDVRYALGYFDDSDGTDKIWNKINWGRSPSLDIEIYFALREALTKKCKNGRQVCGFHESGNPEMGSTVYSKTINLLGNSVDVNLTLTHASASEAYDKNISVLKNRQSMLTAQSDENFFGGLARADIVFYNGHSRNGGGPDFNPPVLDSHGHPDYEGYYKVKRIGIKRVIEGIKKNPNQGLIYGSFSCFSASHFQGILAKTDPKLRMILSSDVIDYFKSLQASIGYLEGLMQGRCGEDLAQFAKRGSLYKEFKGVNFK